MSDIEERVDALERDVTDLKAELAAIPELSRTGFQHMDRRLDTLRANFATEIERKLDGFRSELRAELVESRSEARESRDLLAARLDRVREALAKEIAALKPGS